LELQKPLQTFGRKLKCLQPTEAQMALANQNVHCVCERTCEPVLTFFATMRQNSASKIKVSMVQRFFQTREGKCFALGSSQLKAGKGLARKRLHKNRRRPLLAPPSWKSSDSAEANNHKGTSRQSTNDVQVQIQKSHLKLCY
jgi:hypothetical protein